MTKPEDAWDKKYIEEQKNFERNQAISEAAFQEGYEAESEKRLEEEPDKKDKFEKKVILSKDEIAVVLKAIEAYHGEEDAGFLERMNLRSAFVKLQKEVL